MKNYAFIDSQNLNLGVRSQGWELDFKKFRKYLSAKYEVAKAFLFIGYMSQNKKLYNHLRACGYEIVFKPTARGEHGRIKGNVDAELIVWTMKSVYEKKCHKTIVISGDGDYAVLADFLLEKDALLKFIVPNQKSMSLLIKKVFAKKQKMQLLQYLKDEKEKLAIKKPLYRSGYRSTLGFPDGGDIQSTTKIDLALPMVIKPNITKKEKKVKLKPKRKQKRGLQ